MLAFKVEHDDGKKNYVADYLSCDLTLCLINISKAKKSINEAH